jgi:hypothetical protein
MTFSSVSISALTSCLIPSAVFFLRRQGFPYWTSLADLFVDFEQLAAEFAETVEGLHLALRLAKLGG